MTNEPVHIVVGQWGTEARTLCNKPLEGLDQVGTAFWAIMEQRRGRDERICRICRKMLGLVVV